MGGTLLSAADAFRGATPGRAPKPMTAESDGLQEPGKVAAGGSGHRPPPPARRRALGIRAVRHTAPTGPATAARGASPAPCGALANPHDPDLVAKSLHSSNPE